MKILHVDGGKRWGGGQNQVRLLMRELRRAGVEQACLCPEGSPLAARLREEGLPLVTIPWRRGLSPRALVAIMKHARSADVIHCHDAHSLQLAILPAAVLRRKLIGARRMSMPTSAAKWNRADAVVAVSGAVQDALRASGVLESKIRLVHSGVDVEEVRALPPLSPPLRERLGIPREAYVAGTIGALVELKNHSELAAAAAESPDVHWVIIGDGPARAQLERTIREQGVAGRVHLAGALPDARRALGELDTFVFTSLRDALGTSIIDALACDVPCIAAAAPGPGEVLGPVHAETGCSLYAPGDAAALAAQVEEVRRNGALRARVVAAQRRRLEDFRIEQCAAATLALYEEVMGT